MEYSRIFSALTLVVLLPLAAGCARSDADGDRRLKQLTDELARVQADRDRVDQRLVALETQATSTPAGAKDDNGGSAPSSAKLGATPELRVVRISPDGEKQVGNDPPPPLEAVSAQETAASYVDDGSARPILRVTGQGGGRGRGRSADGAKSDVVVQTLPPDDVDGAAAAHDKGPRPSALDPDARRAYDDALALVRAKKCSAALDAFAGFIVRWPDHPNADNALYWRGECYAEMGDLPRAIAELEGTVARFPMGNKVPDALLKLGILYTKLGNEPRAKEAYARLEREYPRSEARRRIPQGVVTTP